MIKIDKDERLDAFENSVTGFGTDADKTTYGAFRLSPILSDESLESLYHCHDVPARIVEKLPEHCLRKGFEFEFDEETDPPATPATPAKPTDTTARKDGPGEEDDEDGEYDTDPDEGPSEIQTAVKKALEGLGFHEAFLNADCWGRLYGGAALVLGTEDGMPSDKPLDLDRVKSLKWIRAVDRRYLQPLSFYDSGSKAGEPEIYTYSEPMRTKDSAVFPIHDTRLVLFGGARTTYAHRQALNYWEYSILQRPYDVIRTFETAYKAVEILLTDGPQGVWEIKNLQMYVGAGKRQVLEERLRLVGLFRSVARAIVIDKDNESFERQQITYSGLGDLLDRYAQRLAAAAEMPLTLLMGTSPAGLNATGQSDMQQWYDTIEARQKNYVAPRLRRVLEVLCAAKDGPTNGVQPKSIEIEFPSCWTASAVEQAQIDKSKAETASTLIQAEVATPDEVATTPGAHGFKIDKNVRKQRQKLEANPKHQAKMFEQKANPPELDPAAFPPKSARKDSYEEDQHPRGFGGKWAAKAQARLEQRREIHSSIEHEHEHAVEAHRAETEKMTNAIEAARTQQAKNVAEYEQKIADAKKKQIEARKTWKKTDVKIDPEAHDQAADLDDSLGYEISDMKEELRSAKGAAKYVARAEQALRDGKYEKANYALDEVISRDNSGTIENPGHDRLEETRDALKTSTARVEKSRQRLAVHEAALARAERRTFDPVHETDTEKTLRAKASEKLRDQIAEHEEDLAFYDEVLARPQNSADYNQRIRESKADLERRLEKKQQRLARASR